MKPSTICADFIKSFEQCRLKSYMPTADDVPTIGWGSTGPDIHLGMTWTQQQADSRFGFDLARFGNAVAATIGAAPTKQAEFDALVSLAYNIGMGNFAKSTVLRKHKSGDHDAASAAFAMWNKQKGKVLNGLTRRRAAEARMYKGLPV
jgi:lysozyme